MAKKKAKRTRQTKKKTFPCTIYVRDWEGGPDIVENPKDCVGAHETETLAVYKLDSFVTVTNKTTVEPVKPAKKKGKR